MPILPGADPLLLLATILLAGTGLGWLANRVGLPAITGQIVAGILLGPAFFDVFDEGAVQGLAPLTHFALGLIGVTVGAHLNIRRLRNAGRRLFWLLLTEAVVTPLIVASTLFLVPDVSASLAVLLGTLAVSTAPATVVVLVRETRSRGVFVKTLIAAVALNNIACLFLFEVARSAAILAAGDQGSLTDVHILPSVGRAAFLVGQAAFIGAVIAWITHLVSLRIHVPERWATVSAVSLLATYGLASYAGVSPLAACLTLGVVQSNLSPTRERIVDAVFATFEPVILCTFFTLAGLHLSFGDLGRVGLLTGLFVAGRFAGKLLSAGLAMRLAGATERVRRNLGLALLPQAGLAVGLVILVQGDPALADLSELFTAVVLTAVTINELVGPIATKFALNRSGEIGRDRPRLVDFLQEENITTGLHADTMEDAIRQLVELLVRSHHLKGVDREELLASVLAREAQVSTCLGEGLAVPHGDLPEGLGMVGVLGLAKDGLGLPTPDGKPVHCMLLLATPRGERDRHLEVLATMARTVGSDPLLQSRLYGAATPAHAYEILHGEETEDFNYFLEDESPLR
jgi:PTS system fructose-specific IIC component